MEFKIADGHKVRNTDEYLLERCDGNVSVSVQIEWEGCCELCASSVIDIKYKCDVCGETFFPNAPMYSYDLPEFISKHVEKGQS